MTDKTKVITTPLKVFETFAGIGAQHKAITNKELPFEIIKTSEWDARAIIAYAQIHHNAKFNSELVKISKWNLSEVNNYLLGKVFSLDSKKPARIISKPLEFKQILIAANIVNNNLSDINKINGKELKGIDLLTYSFPCQGLSIANMGRGRGMKQDSDSTSNLIWQIHRIIEEAAKSKIELPKYLIMENVKNLLSKKHINDYKEWKEFLLSKGYITYTVKLSGIDFSSLQRRERIFGISIKTKIKNWDTDDQLKELLINKYGNKINDLAKREQHYRDILNTSNLKERKEATPNDTKSRIRMAIENHNLLTRKWANNYEWTFNTLTTKQDRHPNIGMIKNNFEIQGKLNHRFITPREAYQIMDFTVEDFEKVNELYEKNILTKESLYRQAGNSIVVSVLEAIFNFIYDYERGVYG